LATEFPSEDATDGPATPAGAESRLPRFGIARVLGLSLAVTGRQVVPIVLAALILAVIQYAVLVFCLNVFGAIRPSSGTANLPGRIVVLLSNTAVGSLLNGFVTQITLTALDGGRFDLAHALRRALATAPKLAPLILVYVALDVFVPKRWLFLSSPALIAVAILAWVYAAVIVRENGGIADAFARNLRLTSGNRLRIFVILLLIGLVNVAAALVVGRTLTVLLWHPRWPYALTITGALTTGLGGVFEAFAAVAAAVSYRLLRADREGTPYDTVARVFD
jgi:hypothetical protein